MEKHQPDPGRLYPVVPPCVKDIVERIDAQAEVSYPDSGVSRVVMTRELLIEALGEAYTRLEAANKVLDTPSPFKLPKPSHTPAMPPCLKVKSGPFKGKPQMWFTEAEVRALLAEAAERPLPQTKPAAWGMTYMGGLMPTVYVVEGDAVKEFERRNSVYPDSAVHRKLVAVYTVPVAMVRGNAGVQTLAEARR